MENKLATAVGRRILDMVEELGRCALMVRDTAFWLFRSRLEVKQSAAQFVRIGVDSVMVASLTSFFTGMILALQIGNVMKNLFGEPIYMGSIVGFAMVMELGPVITAIVVTGRAGSAMTAEIGSMKVTDQLDALSTLGTDPVRYLVIPRYLAGLITIPILTVFANICGVLGGLIVSTQLLQVPGNVYWENILTYMRISDFMHGFIKSFFFAFIIITVCAFKGIDTRGGAEGVGKSTTAAVVVSMVAILIADYFLSSVLIALGI